MFRIEFGKFPQGATYDTLDMTVWCFATLKRPKSKVKKQVDAIRSSRLKKKRLLSLGVRGY
jgi:hypothetical protein